MLPSVKVSEVMKREKSSAMHSPEDPKSLKSRLVNENKHSEWRQSIPDEEYKHNTSIFEAAKEEALKMVRSMEVETCPKVEAGPSEINDETRQMYEKWRRENNSHKKCPKVNVDDFLYLNCLLNGTKKIKENNECKLSNFNTFWDCPAKIQEALRECVLERNWDRITHICLVLLHFHKKYLFTIRNMCRLMLLYNPKVRENGLEEQFKELINSQINQQDEIKTL